MLSVGAGLLDDRQPYSPSTNWSQAGRRGLDQGADPGTIASLFDQVTNWTGMRWSSISGGRIWMLCMSTSKRRSHRLVRRSSAPPLPTGWPAEPGRRRRRESRVESRESRVESRVWAARAYPGCDRGIHACTVLGSNGHPVTDGRNNLGANAFGTSRSVMCLVGRLLLLGLALFKLRHDSRRGARFQNWGRLRED